MASISLSSYTLRVKDENGNYRLLNNFTGRRGGKDDIYNILNNFLTSYKVECCDNPDKRKFLKVPTLQSSSRIFNGIIETGEYGYESNITTSDGNVSYTKKKDEADMLPFYFLINVEKGFNEGLLLMQRFKQLGIRQAFFDNFSDYFNSLYPRFRIEINPLVPEYLINKYLKDGRIIKIRFIKFGMPTDIADRYRNNDHDEIKGTTQLVVTAGRNGDIPIYGDVIKFLKGEKRLNRLVELADFEYENVKVDVSINNKPKVIDLGNDFKIRPYIDITDEVEINGENGHPKFDSIDKIANELMNDLNKMMRNRANE